MGLIIAGARATGTTGTGTSKAIHLHKVVDRITSILANNLSRGSSGVAGQGGGRSSVFAPLPFAIQPRERCAFAFRSTGGHTPRCLGVGNARSRCHHQGDDAGCSTAHGDATQCRARILYRQEKDPYGSLRCVPIQRRPSGPTALS